MSYEGFTERLCMSGHYSAADVWCDQPTQCVCGAPFRYTHGVDQTNGYDESDPGACHAPKIQIGAEDLWHTDHLGNRYATQRFRYAPVGCDWITVNSKGHATPPYRDDLASGIEAGTAATAEQGAVHESPAPQGETPK